MADQHVFPIENWNISAYDIDRSLFSDVLTQDFALLSDDVEHFYPKRLVANFILGFLQSCTFRHNAFLTKCML